MATAKLWWNGSSWVTYDTTCASKTSKPSSAKPGVRGSIKLIAYDNATVRLYGSLIPDGVSGSGNSLGGTLTVSYGGTSIYVSQSSAKSGETRYSQSGELSTQTGTISYDTGSAGITLVYYISGAKYGEKLVWSGSVSVGTSPFCTISYNDNGGSGSPASQTVCKSVASALSATTPTRAGFSFSHWNTSADDTGTSYSAGASITPSDDVTLYAIWATNQYPVAISADEGITITFDGDTYTNVNVTVNKTYGKVCAYSITNNSGFIIKSRDPATDGSMTIGLTNPSLTATSQRVGCHIDDGAQWVQAMIYLDTGAEWVMAQAYLDNGASWELVY